jgi:predicted PurR-regulated permease PerM
MIEPEISLHQKVKDIAIETAATLAVLSVIAGWCAHILSPFLSIALWGGIIAISTYTPYRALCAKLGGRRKLALAIFLLLGLALVILPLGKFTSSMLESGRELSTTLGSGTITIPPPDESVREWPIVGERLYANWSTASANLGAFLGAHAEQTRAVATAALEKVAGLGLGAVQFLVSILIAGAFLAYADSVTAFVRRLFWRLANERGDDLRNLAVQTVRSVSVGVLGIAAIQALLGGFGMMFVGVPGAGLLALLVLVLAVAQLPPMLVLVPVAIYVYSVESTVVATAFLVWSLLVSFSDMALKPLLLGRGVDAPMPIILTGAIGGMIVAGIVGLFVGAVVLALGYKLLDAWTRRVEPPASGSGLTQASETAQ